MSSCALVYGNINSNIECKKPIKDVYNFNLESINKLSIDCFKTFQHKLINISDEMFLIGKSEFEIENSELINSILEFNPLNYSFSITDDPSLHFYIKFDSRISLFVETYLEQALIHDTYVQIFNSNHPVLEINDTFEKSLKSIIKVLTKELKSTGFNYFPFDSLEYKGLI